MQKKICKISAIVLSLMLSFSLTNVAFAKDVSASEPRSITAEPEGIVVEVANQEEFDKLVQDIEEGNALARAKWEEAIAKSTLSSNKSLLADNLLSSSSYISINCPYTFHSNPFTDYGIAFILRAEVSSENQFTSMHNFLVIPDDSSTKISNLFWKHVFIDGNRTCSINTSFIVSVKNMTGSYSNYDVTKYIEYYATGTYNLY
ncbi:MAG TPA: hypothetical protein VHO70_23320 [Chitinispirillaceae bacterium]|nr:hypothetical protein [Chitinispirillaceae bacterium]